VIRVVQGDLAELAVDAVMRAADEWLGPVGANSIRLDRRAGERFAELCQVQAPLGVGAAVVTGAGNLSAEFVLHIVVQGADRAATADTFRRALSSAWHRAEGWQLGRIGFGPPGLESEGLALEEIIRLTAASFRDRPERSPYPSELHLVVESADQATAAEELLRSLA
jgi:O-acetyl-ADP-ribose deacetylase (regulator of RNase III)